MRSFLMTMMVVMTAGTGLWAEPAPVEAWVQAHGDSRLADLTVADLWALNQASSVSFQQQFYVHSAAAASFLVPGLGQFKTGDPLSGTLHLAGQAALAAGTVYAAWSLLPGDLRNTALSGDQRRSLWEQYWQTSPSQVAGTAAVLAGGLTLSLIHSVWAARDARERAQANLADGKVSFEPRGDALGLRMRW